MFRVFLKRKIISDWSANAAKKVPLEAKIASNPKNVSKPVGDRSLDGRSQENRRLFKRYQVDYKHLTIMNDADIFVVRDVSSKGFSVEASERAFKRLQLGDEFEARMRYFGELYDLQAKVVWKKDHFVGFEIVMARSETFLFLQRLLKPIAVGSTLQLVEPRWTSSSGDGALWFRGEEGSDLLVWKDKDVETIAAWRLSTQGECVEWSQNKGFITGRITFSRKFPTDDETLTQLVPDEHPHPERKQFARDVIMAFEHEIKEELLPTFETT